MKNKTKDQKKKKKKSVYWKKHTGRNLEKLVFTWVLKGGEILQSGLMEWEVCILNERG